MTGVEPDTLVWVAGRSGTADRRLHFHASFRGGWNRGGCFPRTQDERSTSISNTRDPRAWKDRALLWTLLTRDPSANGSHGIDYVLRVSSIGRMVNAAATLLVTSTVFSIGYIDLLIILMPCACTLVDHSSCLGDSREGSSYLTSVASPTATTSEHFAS
jgi:hypothetical protein